MAIDIFSGQLHLLIGIGDKPRGKDYAYGELMKQLHPGAVILMHTVSPDNAEALPSFIQDAKKAGYRFKSLDDLVMEYEN